MGQSRNPRIVALAWWVIPAVIGIGVAVATAYETIDSYLDQRKRDREIEAYKLRKIGQAIGEQAAGVIKGQ